MNLTKKLVLASQSPRRREILSKLRIPFEVKVPDFIEEGQSHLSPREEVLFLAREKARSLSRSFPDALILGADTLVVLGEKKMGKPRDDREAFQMLEQLSGKTHQVFTGLALLDSNSDHFQTFVGVTSVTFHPLDVEKIQKYIMTGEPKDKAGAYGIQGKGETLVKKIQGDYLNVVGLPLDPLKKLLLPWGYRD
jgi:septum formation protein